MRARKPVHIDTTFLQSLLGYNCRRAALAIIEIFLERMAIYGLRPVDFQYSQSLRTILVLPRVRSVQP